jgi:hypothetical protein
VTKNRTYVGSFYAQVALYEAILLMILRQT